MERYFIHTVTVITPTDGSEGLYGNTEPVEGVGVEHPARVGPGGSEELKAGRTTTVTERSLRLPLDADISATSIVEWQGDRYTVEGEPTVINGTKRASHIRARIQKVTGG